MKVKNRKEARLLIEKYRSISLKDIKAVSVRIANKRGLHVLDGAETLTGFGKINKCILCKPIGNPPFDCTGCIHYELTGRPHSFSPCTGTKFYDDISKATTPTKLRNAFRRRADYIEKLLEEAK